MERRDHSKRRPAGFLLICRVRVQVIPVARPENVWTRAGSRARIRQAVVSVKCVRTSRGEVLYIRSDCSPKRVGNLGWRIADNDVAADDIAGHLPASAKIEPVDVSDNPVILDDVVLAYTQESQTEIVAIGVGGG